MGCVLADADNSDVFMDSVNRQIAMKMLVCATRSYSSGFANPRARSILQGGRRAGSSYS